jgi:hypothetical protein
MPRTDTTTAFRVFHMPTSLIDSWRKARDKQGATNLSFVVDATTKHLAPLVRELRAVGLTGFSTERCPVRLELPLGTLADLAEGSERTGVPATQLLSICLGRASVVKRARKN